MSVKAETIGRDHSLDMAKGLGILCIVLLHYESGIIPVAVNTFIGSFMITMFYVSAGWLMALRPPAPTSIFARKRLVSIGLPYLYWGLIIIAFDTLLWICGYYTWYTPVSDVYKFLVLNGIGTLWFLPALFIGEVTWCWFRRRPWWAVVALFVAVEAFLQWYGHTFTGTFGYVVDTASEASGKIMAAPFRTLYRASHAVICVAGGYYFSLLLSPRLPSMSLAVKLCISFSLLVVAYVTTSIPVFSGPLAAALWIFLCPILAPVGFIVLFRVVDRGPVMRYLDYWGRNSLSLMVTHYSIVMVLVAMALQYIFHCPLLGWVSVVAFVLMMPVQYLITELLNRHFPQLLAKKKK